MQHHEPVDAQKRRSGLSRIAHASIAWKHGRRFSLYYLPLQILADWVISVTKIWVLFHPAKQAWMNRGARKLDSTQGSTFYKARTAIAHYLYGFTCTATVLLIGVASGLLPMLEDSPLYLRRLTAPSGNNIAAAPDADATASLGAAAAARPVFGAVLPADSAPSPVPSAVSFAGLSQSPQTVPQDAPKRP